MSTATLRRSGGSLILTIPASYAEQNNLGAGDAVNLNIAGDTLTVRPARRRHDVAVLIAETPAEYMTSLPWENVSPEGGEVW